MKSVVARLVSFTTLPFISLLIPLVALPVVSRVGGVDGWSALAVGQAVGSYAAAVAFVGWNVLGTPLVALAREPKARHELYRRSVYVRSTALAVAAPIAALIAAMLAPASSRWLAALFAFGAALTALGIAWYAVGVSSPSTIALYDLLPRLFATAITVPIVIWTGDITAYAVGFIAAPLVGVAAFHLRTFGRLWPAWPGWRAIRADLTTRRSAWSVEITGNLYASAPVPVASAFGTAADSAAYASGDRLYRYSLYSVVAFGNALQGWVLEAAGIHRRHRNVTAIGAMFALGIVGGAGLASFGSQISRWLFGNAVAVGTETMLWLGLAFFAIATSTALIRNILMPARQDRAVLATTLMSASIGIATMIVAVLWWGPAGVALGLATSELVTLIICVVLVARIGLEPHQTESSPPAQSGVPSAT